MGHAALDGTFLRVNEAFASMLGYRPEELVGKSVADITHPSERHTDAAEIKRLIESEVERFGRTKRYVHRDGQSVWGEVTVSMVRDAAQAPLYLAFVCKDVTAQRDLAMQADASQRMEAVGRLAGGMAHDFNNLLNVILLCGSFARDALDEGTPAYDDVSQIIEAAQRAARLTGQLLAFSERQVQELQTVDLNSIILDVEVMLRRLVGEHIEFVTRFDPELGLVAADVTQIEQIVMNPVLNARDAMPLGGKFIIETTNEILDDESSHTIAVDIPHGPYVVLRATDTGMGIPSEIQPNVFDPFFTTKEKGKGTGLGLSTVYGIVKQCDGFIELDSEVDQGTTFTIHLPRSERRKTIRRPRAWKAGRRGTGTVLVVEDEAGLRRVVLRALEKRGYRTLEAVDGEDGLRVAEQHDSPIDLLLTDVIMPGMTGSQLAEKQLPTAPHGSHLHVGARRRDARRSRCHG